MTLSPAHRGYVHQDVVTAYALACLLLPGSTDDEVVANRKLSADDVFDDLGLFGKATRRIQIKSHVGDRRQLSSADLATDQISFRIDRAIRSVVGDETLADQYRLVVTFDAPDDSLLPFLTPAPHRDPFLPYLSTLRYELDVDALWPADSVPSWRQLNAFDRPTFVRFAERFVVETDCPSSSGDLAALGSLESALLELLERSLGAGHPPNRDRSPLDVLAHLVQFAQTARVHQASRRSGEVLIATGLRDDFGRVEERLPLDKDRLVAREPALDELVEAVHEGPRVVVRGPPGIGKSWMLSQLHDRLAKDGWIVATHYCFIDPLDVMRERRIATDVIFGSLIAELLDADPLLRTDRVPRFAAGPRELETILTNGAANIPKRRIAIVVDGLDHADRIHAGLPSRLAGEIAEELADLNLPDSVVLVVGSQPGDHLEPLLAQARAYDLTRWDDPHIQELALRAGVDAALAEAGLDDEADAVIDAIVLTAAGNPLYATYLARTAMQVARGDAVPPDGFDLAEHLRSAPPFDDYYAWLLKSLGLDTGVTFLAQLLATVAFPVTTAEIAEILPEMSHLVPEMLRRLSPVLAGDPDRGGVRAYHESFQRHVVAADPDLDHSRMVVPVIDWLVARDFFADERAFRFLFPLLRTAQRDEDLLALIDVDFVTRAAQHCQPGDAVIANLSTAAQAAAGLQAWASLTELVELARAAQYLYSWRLDVDEFLAESFGRAYAGLFGAPALAARLLHDGRCTFRPRPGLLLCRLCDDEGVDAPWAEYRAAYHQQRQTDNTIYSGDGGAITEARLVGTLRIAGRDRSIELAVRWLASSDGPPVHPHELVWLVGDMYGFDAATSVTDSLERGEERAWGRVAAAHFAAELDTASALAEAALQDGLPREGIPDCLMLGVDPAFVPPSGTDLESLTREILTRAVRLEDNLLTRWLTELDVLGAKGDEAALFRVENLIPSDTWYHRWLRFAVALRRDLDDATVLSDLHRLSDEIEVFQGDPRVVDLYPILGDIRASFRQMLGRLDDEDWSTALDALVTIGAKTTTWLDGSRNGPLPIDALLALILEAANTEPKRRKASQVAAQLLEVGELGGEFYETHADDHFLLARVHAAAGNRELAERAWRTGCRYLSGYGWRKDITVYEVVDPLSALADADPERVRAALREVQSIVEGVLVHTDGRETRHAIHAWIDLAARRHPEGALTHLANEDMLRVPSFGDLDHAFPIALSALHEDLPAIISAAGWVGAGTEVRRTPRAGLAGCEVAATADADTAWSAVVAAVVGDGTGCPPGATAEILASAERLGRTVGELPAEPVDDGEPANHPISPLRHQPFSDTLIGPTVFEIDHDGLLQIAAGVRRWRAQPERISADAVVNAVGWRLLVMYDAGRRDEAEDLLRRIARDTPTWPADDLLVALAEGLTRFGASSLAALAATLAYTRARDGWRRFAGTDGQDVFLSGVHLDDKTAWATLAAEVADGVARGGENGITVHLIEVLAAAGRTDEAYAAWAAARRVIENRLPATGPADSIEVVYDDTAAVPLSALTEALVGRLNHCLVAERRAATAGLALLASQDGLAIGSAIEFAAHRAPVSVLIAVLQIADSYEPEPYEGTRRCEDVLQEIARGELVSARVLARRLLQRAGFSTNVAPALEVPIAPALDDERIDMLRRLIGEARLRPIEAVWPDFGRVAAQQLELVWSSDEFRDQMKSVLQRLKQDRHRRDIDAWMPEAEARVRVLQTTATAARSALASAGTIDPRVEDEVGLSLLGMLDLGVRFSLSRTLRPQDYPLPTETATMDSEAGLRAVDEAGDFEGWIVLAHHERELVRGDEYDKPLVANHETWSGLQFTEGPLDLSGQLPLGIGNAELWLRVGATEAVPPVFQGPTAGLDVCLDAWSTVEVLTPHPALVLAADLRPAPFADGLTLLDSAGNPAVVARQWRQETLRDEELSEQEYRIVGRDLLARPDVVTTLAGRAIGEPVHMTTTVVRDSPSSW